MKSTETDSRLKKLKYKFRRFWFGLGDDIDELINLLCPVPYKGFGRKRLSQAKPVLILTKKNLVSTNASSHAPRAHKRRRSSADNYWKRYRSLPTRNHSIR